MIVLYYRVACTNIAAEFVYSRKKTPVRLDIHFYFNISGESSPEFSQHFFLTTFSDKREVMVAADPVPFYALANIKFNNVFNTCY